MSVSIKAVSYYLPKKTLTNEDLSVLHPEWPVEKIYSKTGIRNRHISHSDEYSLDMAIEASKLLFKEHDIKPYEIDFIIFCTQTPKHIIPSSACVLQNALGLPTHVGAIDVNQGCSGYVYSLMLAESLIVSEKARNILLITADTYTKLIDTHDRSLKTLFGDAATASLIVSQKNTSSFKTVFEFGTDGSGSEKLISKNLGLEWLSKSQAYLPDLYMDGSGIFKFTLDSIPLLVEKILDKANICIQEIDLFIFHQANNYMLENLRRKIGICTNKFFVHLEDVGNTVSSSIPIALHAAIQSKKITRGNKVMLVGFGVGLSWAASILEF